MRRQALAFGADPHGQRARSSPAHPDRRRCGARRPPTAHRARRPARPSRHRGRARVTTGRRSALPMLPRSAFQENGLAEPAVTTHAGRRRRLRRRESALRRCRDPGSRRPRESAPCPTGTRSSSRGRGAPGDCGDARGLTRGADGTERALVGRGHVHAARCQRLREARFLGASGRGGWLPRPPPRTEARRPSLRAPGARRRAARVRLRDRDARQARETRRPRDSVGWRCAAHRNSAGLKAA